jgi:hypothetical protein
VSRATGESSFIIFLGFGSIADKLRFLNPERWEVTQARIIFQQNPCPAQQRRKVPLSREFLHMIIIDNNDNQPRNATLNARAVHRH